jgi:hypothetical protein
MRRLSIVAAVALVSGCDFNLDKLFDFLMGKETNVVVLSKQPTLLSETVSTLTSPETMKVIGESTYVCFALRGDIPLQNSKVMDEAYGAAIHNAKVKVDVVLASGDRISLHEPMEAWNMYGKVIKGNELSACASASCGSGRLPVGSEVRKIEVSSKPNLLVQGIYWESEKSPFEESAPKASSSQATSPGSKPACGA